VKSIQSRQTLKDQILYETKINAQKNTNNFSDNEGFRSEEENKMSSNFLMSDEIAEKIDSQKDSLSKIINKRDSIEENKEENLKKQISHRSDDKYKTSTDMNNKYETLMNDNIEGSFPNPNFDNGSQHLSNDGFTKSGIGFRDKESQIAQIVKGKYHLLKLTVDGKVYASGKSYYGVVGLGGSSSAGKPQLIPNLANIKIKQISAGVYHSLALAENGDLYTWGLGEEGKYKIKEGQLGLNSEYKIASSPKYLKFFYKKPVQFIACGHNYSLAITQDVKIPLIRQDCGDGEKIN
jgi:alpha-tubulin suppressor-like RCC1 family protein